MDLEELVNEECTFYKLPEKLKASLPYSALHSQKCLLLRSTVMGIYLNFELKRI